MFRTDLLSIIRSLNTVFTAIGICYTVILKMCKVTSVYIYIYIYIYTVFTAIGNCHAVILKMGEITSVCVCVCMYIHTHTLLNMYVCIVVKL